MDRKSVCRERAVRDHAPVWWILFRDFAQLTSPLPFLGSFVFLYVWMFCLEAYILTCSCSTQGGQKRVSDPWRLELQTLVSWQMWLLGTQMGSSGGTTRAFTRSHLSRLIFSALGSSLISLFASTQRGKLLSRPLLIWAFFLHWFCFTVTNV